jgi:hypothetical protein
MKLSKLFVIALLAGTLGVIGCSDDDNGGTAGTGGSGTAGTGGSGTAGTGGSGTDACTGPLCDAATAKEACNELIGECNRAVQVDIPPETCDLLGNEVFCEEGAGGGGGTGGTGGTGGGGGTGVPPDADEVCDEGLCTDPGAVQDECKELLDWCVEFAPESKWDECVGAALLFVCEVV